MDAFLPGPEREPSMRPDGEARFRAVFLKVAPAMFIGSLDQTIVAAALPAVAATLGRFDDIAWIVTSYLLAATAAAPIYGRLGDAFGRRRALLGALALFLAGSTACALAPSLPLLIGARALQGLGGGGLMTLAQALIGEAVTPKARGRFQGWFGAIFALASTIGPVVGGSLTEHWGWRSIFWINLPLGIAACVAALGLAPRPGGGRFGPDLPGTALFVGATLALLLLFSRGAAAGWLSPVAIALAVVATSGYALLWRTERRSADPLIAPDLVRDPVVWRACACVLLFAAVLFAAIVQLPLFLQLVFGMTPAASGLLLVPLTLAQVAVSTATGLHISRTGRPVAPMAAGLAVAASGLAGLAATLNYGSVAVLCCSLIFGLGLGTTMPAAQTMVQWAAGAARLGSATAVLSVARSVGGVIGAALAAAILIGVAARTAPGTTSDIAEALSSAGTGTTNSGGTASALATAFRSVFGSLACLSGLGALLAWSIPSVDLSDPSPGSASR